MTVAPEDPTLVLSELVGAHLGVAPGKITGQRKGAPMVAFARQVLAYLLHTEAQFDKQKVGRLLQRHRSTIGHAIEVMEDRRDDEALSSAIDSIAAQFRQLRSSPAPTDAVAEPSPVRLTDAFVGNLTAALSEAGLYGAGDSVDLDRTEDTMRVEIMLKARTNTGRTDEVGRATMARQVMLVMSRASGWSHRFSDAFWSESGTKGWRVVGKFRRRPQSRE